MGEGSRAAGRVGSDFLSAIAGRVGLGRGFAGSGPRKVTRGQLWHRYTTAFRKLRKDVLAVTETWL